MAHLGSDSLLFSGPSLSLPDDALQAFLDLVGFSKSMSVADLGCGAGVVSKQLAARSRQVVAIDSDMKIVEFAASHHRASNINYVHGGAKSISLGECVDLLFCYESFHLFGRRRDTLSNMRRIVCSPPRLIVAWCTYGWEQLLRDAVYSLYTNVGVEFDEWGFQDCEWALSDARVRECFGKLSISEFRSDFSIATREIAYLLASASYLDRYPRELKVGLHERLLELCQKIVGGDIWRGAMINRAVHTT